jgi:hypothetical protein
MKDAVLLELAARWERDAQPPKEVVAIDESEAGKIAHAKVEIEREILRACADTLRSLVKLIGDA